MTYYISQGRVEAPSRIGSNNATVLLQIYFSICVPKIIKIQCSWTKLLQKNKRCNFFAPQCSKNMMKEIVTERHGYTYRVPLWTPRKSQNVGDVEKQWNQINITS